MSWLFRMIMYSPAIGSCLRPQLLYSELGMLHLIATNMGTGDFMKMQRYNLECIR